MDGPKTQGYMLENITTAIMLLDAIAAEVQDPTIKESLERARPFLEKAHGQLVDLWLYSESVEQESQG